MITVSNYNANSSSSSCSNATTITEIQAGSGITVINPQGPTVTVGNDGVLDIVGGDGIIVTDQLNGTYEVAVNNLSPFSIYNTTNSNALILHSSATTGLYNPMVNAGDQVLVAEGNIGTEVLVLTTESNTNAGVRVTSVQAMLQSGGSSLVPQAYVRAANNQVSLFSEDNTNIQSNLIVNIQGNNINLTGTTQFVNLAVYSGSTAMPPANDSSTIIPSTAWVQNAMNFVSKTVTVKYTLDETTITMPYGVQFVDVVVIGQGGSCGANNGIYYGGAGGGGTTCSLLKMPVREGQYFFLDYAPNYIRLKYSDPTTGVSPTVSSDICYIPNGGDGANATGSSNGAGGGPGAAPTLYSTYGAWTTLYGTNGFQAQPLSGPPAQGGAPRGRAFVNGETGCGQRQSTESYGRGAVYITYYYI